MEPQRSAIGTLVWTAAPGRATQIALGSKVSSISTLFVATEARKRPRLYGVTRDENELRRDGPTSVSRKARLNRLHASWPRVGRSDRVAGPNSSTQPGSSLG